MRSGKWMVGGGWRLVGSAIDARLNNWTFPSTAHRSTTARGVILNRWTGA